MTASAAPVGPAASCACSASCTRSASGKPTCMITLRARRPRPRRAAAFVERSPDACEHALVWLLAALHSQGSKQERNQPACTTRRPARLAVLARRAISRLRVRCQPDTARRAWHSRGLRPREGGPPGERAAWPAEVRASPRVQPADVCRRVMRRSAQSWQHLAGQCRPRPPLWRRAGVGTGWPTSQPARSTGSTGGISRASAAPARRCGAGQAGVGTGWPTSQPARSTASTVRVRVLVWGASLLSVARVNHIIQL